MHLLEGLLDLVERDPLGDELVEREAALQGQVDKVKNKPWAARVWYAYADALLEVGREADARSWFAKAAVADQDGETDAIERVEELDGVHLQEVPDSDGQAVPEGEGDDPTSTP